MREAVRNPDTYPAVRPEFFDDWSTPRPQAGAIYDQEQDDSFEKQPNWLEITQLCQQAEAEAPKIYDHETELAEPARRASFRQRTRRLMARANGWLRDTSIMALTVAQTKAETAKDYYTDSERGGRRRTATAVVAGALALAGAAYAQTRGVDVRANGQHHGIAADIAEPSVKPQHHEAVQQVMTTTLDSGENPWTIAEEHLQSQGVAYPTDAQIWNYDQRILRFNHLNTEAASQLAVGTELKLPKL